MDEAMEGNAKVLVAGHPLVPEACTICHVIQLMLQKTLEESVRVITTVGLEEERVRSELRESFSRGSYLLLVLSRGVLEVLDFAALVAAAGNSLNLTLIPILADTSFIVPNMAYYDRLREGSVLEDGELRRRGGSLEMVANGYEALFSVLGCRFSPHGSLQIQETEIAEMVPRFHAAPEQMKSVPSVVSQQAEIKTNNEANLEAPNVQPDCEEPNVEPDREAPNVQPDCEAPRVEPDRGVPHIEPDREAPSVEPEVIMPPVKWI